MFFSQHMETLKRPSRSKDGLLGLPAEKVGGWSSLPETPAVASRGTLQRLQHCKRLSLGLDGAHLSSYLPIPSMDHGWCLTTLLD